MVSRHKIRGHLPRLLAFLLVFSLVLVACERPLQDNDAPAAEEVTEEDLEQGGGTPAETEGDETTGAAEGETAAEGEEAEEATEAEPAEETEAAEEAEMSEEEAGAEEEEAAETDEEEASPRPENEAEEEAEEEADEMEGAEETVAEGAAEAEASEEEAAEAEETEPRTHVVQAGENLYRIGLQYGISWVVLAEANGIANPNRIVVGQVLTIPSEADDDDTPTPTPTPGEETTYIVQPGDNLYRIGRMFNMSWVEIAEANGIVNPNRILVGQELTIPGAEPAEEVTHTVQPGETLFRISLQYGVPWTTIATENNINPPYVIYPGQILTIPGG